MADTRKELGRIQDIRIGHGGYQGCMFGASFTLGGSGWGVCDFWGAWSPALMKRDAHSKWSEQDRSDQLASVCVRLASLLEDAHVDDVMKLQGQPVEVTFKGNTLESWRLLTEVLA